MRYKFNEIAINSVEKRIPTEDDKANYIGLEHLESGSLSVSTWGSAVSLKGEKLVMRKGDVLFGKRNTYLRRASIAPHDGLFSAHGMVLRPKPEVIDPSFFPFFVNSDELFNSTIRISVGSLSPTVNWKDMKELEFDLPPIEKQRELAELLWAANDLKESYKKLIVASDEMLKAKFREMFGKCGVQSAECGVKLVPIGDTGQVFTGSTPSMKFPEYYENKDLPFYKPSDFGEGLTRLSDSEFYVDARAELKCRVFDAGAILVTCIGTVGKVGFATKRGTCNQQINFIVPNNDIDACYLAVALTFVGAEMAESAKASVVPIVNKTEFCKYKIPLPPLALQQEFVEIARKADETKAALKKSIADVESVIKGLINR